MALSELMILPSVEIFASSQKVLFVPLLKLISGNSIGYNVVVQYLWFSVAEFIVIM